MLESSLVDGRPELTDPSKLIDSQSITDTHKGWEMSVPMLRNLTSGVTLALELDQSEASNANPRTH